MHTRGVSTVLGFALILVIVIGGMVGVLTIGQDAIVETRERIAAQNAENLMSSLASDVALVAFDSASRQTVTAGQGQNLYLHPDRGRIEITIHSGESHDTVVNTSLGAVTMRTRSSSIAYQAGGVWRDTGGGARMISPPQFHYRENTLTFPIVTIEGQGASDSVAFDKNTTEQLYPGEAGQNPVAGDIVYVNVTSEYHRGWYDYFTERTSASVTHYPDQKRVVAALTTPIEEQFGQSVSTTVDQLDAIQQQKSAFNCDNESMDAYECPVERGATAPSASGTVDDWVSTCEDESGPCTEYSTAASNGTVPGGVYSIDSDTTFNNDVTLDTSRGNVTLVVDADTEFTGNKKNRADIDITGKNGVVIYHRGKMKFSGNAEINTGGDPGDLLVLVHSDVETIEEKGTPQFTGLIYAPNTNFSINGGGGKKTTNILGSLVVETASVNSNAGYVEHADAIDLRVDPDLDPDVTYLHVTKNRINATTAP